jgi:hypothetical protein
VGHHHLGREPPGAERRGRADRAERDLRLAVPADRVGRRG